MRTFPSAAIFLSLFAACGLNRADRDDSSAVVIASTQSLIAHALDLSTVVVPTPTLTPLATCPATLPERYASDARAKGTLVVVFKSLYMLGLYRDSAVVTQSNGELACFPVAMGLKPWGSKTSRDNISTPEGWYRFATKQDVGQTTFYRGFMLNYPNTTDVERAFASDVIDEHLKKRLLGDITAGRTPPQGTEMGGEILIHGEGAGVPVWTAGCIAVENEVMDFLFRHVQRGDDVLVTPWTERYTQTASGKLVVSSVPLPEGQETELVIPFTSTRFAWESGITSATLRINSKTGDVGLTLK